MKFFYEIFGLSLIILLSIRCETREVDSKILSFLNDSMKASSKRYSRGPQLTKRFQDGYYINESAYIRSRLKQKEQLLDIYNDRTSSRSDTTAYYHINDSVFVQKFNRGDKETHYLFDLKTQNLKASIHFGKSFSKISHYYYSDKLDSIRERLAIVNELDYNYDDVAEFEQGRKFLFTEKIDSLWQIVVGESERKNIWHLKYEENKENIYLNDNIYGEIRIGNNNNIISQKNYSTPQYYYKYEGSTLLEYKYSKYSRDSIIKQEFGIYDHNSEGLVESSIRSHIETGDTVTSVISWQFKELVDGTTVSENYIEGELGVIYHFDKDNYWKKLITDSTFCLRERKIITKI